MHELLEGAPIGVIEAATDGTTIGVNRRAGTVLEVDRETVTGRDVREWFPASTAAGLEAVFEDGDTPTAFEEYYPGIDRWLAVEAAAIEEGEATGAVAVYVRDISEARADRQRIDRLERRLDRTEAIDRLVATVLRDLIEAGDRTAIAETVCDRLGATDLYEFAWMGERDRATDRLRIGAAGGDAPELIDSLRDHLGGGGTLPEQRVVATGESAVVETIADDDRVPDPVRLAAFSRGLQSAVAVPVAYRGTVYGVLGVYAAREEGISDQERTSLETLGAIAGFAINAHRQESLLFADTVTVIGLEVADEELPFVEAAADTGSTLSLEGVVPRDDGTVLCYLGAEGDPEALTRFLDDHPKVAATRVVDGDTDRLEVELDGAAPVETLAAWGATVRSAEYTGRHAEIRAEVPPDAELAQVVDAVADAFSDVELTAKERRARGPETVEAFRDELDEALTEKQRTVLRTAFHAEYFDSPRGSTSEEVAEALDITGPTVLYHLRQAQRKLLEAFFEAEASDPPP